MTERTGGQPRPPVQDASREQQELSRLINLVMQHYLKFAFIPSAVVFAFGYLINATYYRGIGMLSLPFVRMQYIESGLTFLAFSLSLTSPLLVGMVVKRNLKEDARWSDVAFGGAQVLSVYIFILLLVVYALFMEVNSKMCCKFPQD